MKKIKKICLNCKFAKLQLTDDGTDLDFDKSLVCIKYDALSLNKMYYIDLDGENQKVLGIEIEDEHSCKSFTINKAREKDILDGC